MNSEKKWNEDQLHLIASMINRAKNNFAENGLLYLVWGWTILLCCAVQFVADYFFAYPYAHYVWLATWLVLIFQIIYLKRQQKKQKVHTYSDEIISGIWWVFFFCMLLIVFICLQWKRYEMINPLILVLYGVPTILCGIVMKFRPLILGGVCSWLLAVASPFVPFEFQILLIALAIIFAWIIPGYQLQIKYKKHH